MHDNLKAHTLQMQDQYLACLDVAEQSLAPCFHDVGHICKLLASLVGMAKACVK